jgi:hypothetical protein
MQINKNKIENWNNIIFINELHSFLSLVGVLKVFNFAIGLCLF